MDIFKQSVMWFWENISGLVLIVAQHSNQPLTFSHFLSLFLLCGLMYAFYPMWVYVRLLCRFRGKRQRKSWKLGKVVEVIDGDTICVRLCGLGKVVKVRLLYIDAPESQQPYGDKALKFLHKKTYGQRVLLVCASNPDRYGRVLAEVFCLHLRHSANLTMVEHGLAWAYQGTKMYTTAEQVARRKNVGLWRDKRPMNPADWRRKNRAS